MCKGGDDKRGGLGWLRGGLKGTANARKPAEDAIAPPAGKHVPLTLDTVLIRVDK